MSSLILNKQIDSLKAFLARVPNEFEGVPESELSLIIEGQKLLLENKQYLKRTYREKGGKNAYIATMRAVLLEKGDFNYEEIAIIINQIFYEKFTTPQFNYLKAVSNYLHDALIDEPNASEEWRTYFRFRFRKTIADFIESLLLGHQLTVNFGLWTFKGLQLLPVYGINSKNLIGTKEEKRRRKAFTDLRPFQEHYSFIWEVVSNDVQTIFYFDQVEHKHMYINVYEIDADVSAGIGQGKRRFFGKCTIQLGNQTDENTLEYDPPYRDKAFYDPSKKDWTLKEIEVRRKHPNVSKENLQEKNYQYSIIRFLIRSGIFNPEKIAFKESLTGRVIYDIHLLQGQDSLKKICKEQYKASFKRSAFDHKDKFNTNDDSLLDQVIAHIDRIRPEYLNYRIATFEIGLFWLIENSQKFDLEKGNDIDFIFWLPVLTNWRGKLTGGTIFLNSNKRIGDLDKEINSTSKVPQEIITILHYLSGMVMENQIQEIEDAVKGEALNSAAISIMARNISHNIGSHVLSYLKKKLLDEDQMIEENVFENILSQEDGELLINSDLLIQDKFQKKYFVAPYLRSLGRLMEYFQERQDYVGAIAAKWHLYFSPINFKEQIFNYFYKPQIIQTNYAQQVEIKNLILDYITFSEGFQRKDIEFSYKAYDGGDYEVAIPTGITGRQGFFTILENLIRNSAKHGDSKEKRGGILKIIITLKVAEGNKEYYEVQILDNGGEIKPDKLKKIRESLSKPLTKRDTGAVDEEHKGIKEMQIASAWLRGIRPAELFTEGNSYDKLPILQVNAHSEYDMVGLKYTLYLKRPKEVLLIIQENQWANYYNKEELKPEFKHFINWNWSIQIIDRFLDDFSTPQAHRFNIIHPNIAINSKQKNKIEAIKNRTSVRFLTLPELTDIKLRDPNWDFKSEIYKNWLDGTGALFSEKNKDRYQLMPLNRFYPSELPIGVIDKRVNDVYQKGEVITREFGDPEEQLILFRHHNDVPKQFQDYQERSGGKFYNTQIYLDGITGNNSNNRLLRNEVKDDFWLMRIRESALTKILIIDERIWKSYRDQGDPETTIERMRKKNIYLITLEKGKGEAGLIEDSKIYFWNLKYEPVGELDKNGEIKFYDDVYYKFHFISLHQGLFDRMLNFCDETLSSEIQDDKEKSEKLFQVHFKEQCFDQHFKPFRYIIHSGRSRTPFLPKGISFLQLSALDAALSDCKYTLTELLYSSILESNQK